MLAGEEWQREAASAGVRKKLLGSCCMNGKSGRRHNWELTKEMYNGLFKNFDKEWMEREREKAPVGSTANLFLLFYRVFLNLLKAPLNELAKLSGKPLEGLLGNMRLLECAQISKQRRWRCFDSDG